jgi:hypothetical protein
VSLHAGDVTAAIFHPLSLTSLGASGKNQEVNFGEHGITMALALACAGGLQSLRSDAQEVGIFRPDTQAALDRPCQRDHPDHPRVGQVFCPGAVLAQQGRDSPDRHQRQSGQCMR